LTAIAEEASERSQEHVDAINAEVEAFYGRAAELQGRISEAVAARAPNAEDFDWVGPTPAGESDDPLFDSTRDYLEQVDRYRTHLGKPTSRRTRNGNGGAP
jgi:hypothetical protein